jgi:hypothetical protein
MKEIDELEDMPVLFEVTPGLGVVAELEPVEL